MDNQTRVGLNFFISVVVVLALVALLSSLMLPPQLHGHLLYILLMVGLSLGAGYGLVYGGVLEAWELEPLPARSTGESGGSAGGDAVADEDLTPAERFRRRRENSNRD